MSRFHSALIFILMSLIIGCSSHHVAPLVPSDTEPSQTLNLPEIDDQESNRSILGMWTVDFNLESLEYSITPRRDLEAHWKITSMIPFPELDIISYDTVSGIMDIDVKVTNPFGINGFDLRLIIYTDNSGNRLKNADDWTGIFDIPGGSQINPFKAYAKDEDNRKFTGFTNHTERLQLFFPSGLTLVNFAVDVSYPANCEEPYEIRSFSQQTLFDTEGAEAWFSIDVLDWQDDVTSVQLYCPSITAQTLVPFSYDENNTWKVKIINAAGASPGAYIGFILAQSSNSGATALYDSVIIAVQSNNEPGPITGYVISPGCPVFDVNNGMTLDFEVTASSESSCEPIVLYQADWDYDGLTFNVDGTSNDGIFKDAGPFTNPNCSTTEEPVTYTVAFRAMDSCFPPNINIFTTCEVTVDRCCGLISGEIESPECPIENLVHGQTVDFAVSASSANGGNPIQYYVADFDYDGVTFDVDVLKYDGNFTNAGPFYNPNCGGSGGPVTYRVAFGAVDSCNPANSAIFAECEVTVDSCCGLINGEIISPVCPISDILDGETIDFEVTASSDFGGDPITSYEVDWDYDGITFDVDDSNSDGLFFDCGPFINPNCGGSGDPVSYTVAFRATDSCNPSNSSIFATCEVRVDKCCGPINGEIITPSCPVTGVLHRQTVDFTVSASSDNGGDPITGYAADWDYDGVNFDVDATSNDGVFNDGGPFVNQHCPTPNSFTYTVAFRATDSCDPPNQTIFATCEVTVEPCDNWDRTRGGASNDEGRKVVSDSLGNYYVTGRYAGVVDFDPGSGTDFHYGSGAYIAKYNSGGDYIWARTWGEAESLDLECYGTDIYVVGYFSNTVDFDPGPEINEFTAQGSDIYLSKFDTAGNYKWTFTLGGNYLDNGTSVTIDNDGVIYISGFITYIVDFDPGTGVDEHGTELGYSHFVSSYNANKTYRWARTWPASSIKPNYVCSFNEYTYITGSFSGTVDFDPGSGVEEYTANGEFDVYLCKYTNNGEFLWAQTYNYPLNEEVNGLAVDTHQNIYVIDNFTQLSNRYSQILKFNQDGNFEWSKCWGKYSSGASSSYHVSTNKSGDIFIIGSFLGEVDFDPSTGTDIRSSNDDSLDIYISKFDADGNFNWVETWGSESHDEGLGIGVDYAGNLILTGHFRETIAFFSGSVSSNGGSDVFLLRMAQ